MLRTTGLHTSPSLLDLFLLTLVVLLLNTSLLRSFIEIKKVLDCDPEHDLQLFPFIHWIPSSLSPSWNFFGPNPGHYDYRILIRAKLRNTVTPWKEPQLFTPVEHKLYPPFWSRHRYTSRLLLDVINILVGDLLIIQRRSRPASVSDMSVLQITNGYLACLKLTLLQTDVTYASDVQFALAKTAHSFDAPQLILRSGWHQVEASPHRESPIEGVSSPAVAPSEVSTSPSEDQKVL